MSNRIPSSEFLSKNTQARSYFSSVDVAALQSQQEQLSTHTKKTPICNSVIGLLDKLESDPKYLREFIKMDDRHLGNTNEQSLLCLAKQQAELKLQLGYTEHRFSELVQLNQLSRDIKQSLYARQVTLYQRIVENYKQLALSCDELGAREQCRVYAKQSHEYALLGEKILKQELNYYIPKACQTEINYERERLAKTLFVSECTLHDLVLAAKEGTQAYDTIVNRRQKKVNRFFSRVIQLYRQQIKFYNQLMTEALLSENLIEQKSAQKNMNDAAWRKQTLAELSVQQADYQEYKNKKFIVEQFLKRHLAIQKILNNIHLFNQQCDQLAQLHKKTRHQQTDKVIMTLLQDLLCQNCPDAQDELQRDLSLILKSLQDEFAELEKLSCELL